MAINLSAIFYHKEAISNKVRYARIDNTNNPQWIWAFPDPINSPAVIAYGIDNGQYQVEATPIYADGRVCDPYVTYTPTCTPITSINGYIQGGNLIVQYSAPYQLPKVRITVLYPNGGSYIANYVNNGNDITIPLPTNVFGSFTLSGQGVCDENTQFYSAASTSVSISNNANPTVVLISNTDTGVGGSRTQIFQIGDSVQEGNRYVFTVYSHDVTVLASFGDSPSNIVAKAVAAINATTATQWNDHGSAPAVGTTGFPPTAIANGNQISITLNYQNQFGANAYTT